MGNKITISSFEVFGILSMICVILAFVIKSSKLGLIFLKEKNANN